MDFEIVTNTDKFVSGLQTGLTTSQKENHRRIREHWKYFNNRLRLSKLSFDENWEKYGVITKTNGRYFYLSAIPAKYQTAGFLDFEIPGGQFAKFCHRGNLGLINATVYDIYRNILPSSALDLDYTRSMIHYERYDAKFHWKRSDSIIELFVPLVQLNDRVKREHGG